jgi:hypothetical protein
MPVKILVLNIPVKSLETKFHPSGDSGALLVKNLFGVIVSGKYAAGIANLSLPCHVFVTIGHTDIRVYGIVLGI